MEGYKERYFVKEDGDREEREVTREEFMAAEANAGFSPKIPGTVATSGFSGYGIEGRVACTSERVKKTLARGKRRK